MLSVLVAFRSLRIVQYQLGPLGPVALARNKVRIAAVRSESRGCDISGAFKARTRAFQLSCSHYWRRPAASGFDPA